jgi:hypothetical protein
MIDPVRNQRMHPRGSTKHYSCDINYYRGRLESASYWGSDEVRTYGTS